MGNGPNSDQYTNTSASATTNSLQPKWWKQISWLQLGALLVVLIGTYILIRPLFTPAVPEAENSRPIDNIGQFSSNRSATILYFVNTPTHLSTTDVFSLSLTLTNTSPSNLTNSVDFAEYYPQPSPDDQKVAFVAISASGDSSLRMRQSDGQIIDLSYQAATDSEGAPCSVSLRAAPQWNEDSKWIAVLAECGQPGNKTVRLYAFGVNPSGVVDLSPKARYVTDFRWTAPNTLVFSDLQSNRQVGLFRVDLNQPEPELLANLSAP